MFCPYWLDRTCDYRWHDSLGFCLPRVISHPVPLRCFAVSGCWHYSTYVVGRCVPDFFQDRSRWTQRQHRHQKNSVIIIRYPYYIAYMYMYIIAMMMIMNIGLRQFLRRRNTEHAVTRTSWQKNRFLSTNSNRDSNDDNAYDNEADNVDRWWRWPWRWWR